MLYFGLQSAMCSSGFNISLSVSFERHTIPQAGMVSCDFNVFSVWEPGEGPPHMGRPSSVGRSKGIARAGYGVMATLGTDREQQEMGLEICPCSD